MYSFFWCCYCVMWGKAQDPSLSSEVKWKWVSGMVCVIHANKSLLLNVTQQHLRVSLWLWLGIGLLCSLLCSLLCTCAEYSGQSPCFGWFLLFQEEPSVPVYCIKTKSVRIKSGSPFKYTIYSTNLPSSSSGLGLNFSSKYIYIYIYIYI
jgi:hypothetical protein